MRRASLTAGLLNALESALCEVYENAPLGSQVLPFPETPETSLEAIGRGFRGRRGRVLLRESVNVSAAGGPAPQTDWKPQDVTPDLSRSLAGEALTAARVGVALAFGVLPGALGSQAQGPMVREAQRHLAQWTLQPIAELLAEECREKLATPVEIDLMQPLQAFDLGGSARAVATLVSALAEAKAAGIDPAGVFKLADWQSPN